MRQTDSVNPDEEVQDRQPETKEFCPNIQGLRAVAVLAVVLFHADMPGVGGGFVGVDVFFVISGFLITGLLWREVSSTGTIRLRDFYGARARRLLPASATVGVAIMVGAAALAASVANPERYLGWDCQRVVCQQLPVCAARCRLPRGHRGRPRRSSTTGRWVSRSSSIWCGRL